MLSIAVVGFGKRSSDMTRRLMEIDADVQLTAIADPNIEGVRATFESRKIRHDNTKIFADVESFAKELEPILNRQKKRI